MNKRAELECQQDVVVVNAKEKKRDLSLDRFQEAKEIRLLEFCSNFAGR